ncbi:MAG: nuclear transport factor 2 family protein [Terriglobia bacterium]
MRRIVLVPLLAVALAGALNADPVPSKEPAQTAAQQVLKIENEVNDAIGKNDWKTVVRMWSPDMDYTNQSGHLLTRADFVNALKSGKEKFLTMEHRDLRARAYGDCGDMVAVTGYSTSHIDVDGKLSVGPRRFTDVWVKRNGQWRLVIHHVTNVAQ